MKNIIIRKAEHTDLDAVYNLVCELESIKLDKDPFTQICSRQVFNSNFHLYLSTE